MAGSVIVDGGSVTSGVLVMKGSVFLNKSFR